MAQFELEPMMSQFIYEYMSDFALMSWHELSQNPVFSGKLF